jgi:hypothetical protein
MIEFFALLLKGEVLQKNVYFYNMLWRSAANRQESSKSERFYIESLPVWKVAAFRRAIFKF